MTGLRKSPVNAQIDCNANRPTYVRPDNRAGHRGQSGLGKAYVEALLSAGEAKVYATARDVTTIKDHPRLVPIPLDLTSGLRYRGSCGTL
jgi:hypothetical protein